MPTVTSLSGWTVSNIGPLTTTFTAGASCSTALDNVRLAIQPEAPIMMTSCNLMAAARTFGECYPSGSAIDAVLSSIEFRNPLASRTIRYFSPAFACPLGWSTVGLATKAADGAITSSGAAFVPSETPKSVPFAGNPQPNVFLQAMNTGETGVLCCPSSMIGNLQGECYSPLPTSVYQPTFGCIFELPGVDVTITRGPLSIFGTTLSGPYLFVTGTAPISESRTTSISPSSTQGTNTTTLIGVSALPMVTLLHQASDVTAAAAGPTPSPNAAVSVRLGTGCGVAASMLMRLLAIVISTTLFLML